MPVPRSHLGGSAHRPGQRRPQRRCVDEEFEGGFLRYGQGTDVSTSFREGSTPSRAGPKGHVQEAGAANGDDLPGAAELRSPSSVHQNPDSGQSTSIASVSEGALDGCSTASTLADRDAEPLDQEHVYPIKGGRREVGAPGRSGTGRRPRAVRRERWAAAQGGPEAATHATSEGQRAGRNLLSLLRAGAPPQQRWQQHQRQQEAPRRDPQPLSTDEYQLWVMAGREDAEMGADVNNEETFGEDANRGWSFEENLAANDRLQQLSRESQVVSFECQTRRLHFSISEIVKYVEVAPESLKQVLVHVTVQGWENITWKNNYTALHVASEFGCPSVMPLLVSLGADPWVKSAKGRTALDVAKKKLHAELDVAKKKQYQECVHMLQQLQSATQFEDIIVVACAQRGIEVSPLLCSPLVSSAQSGPKAGSDALLATAPGAPGRAGARPGKAPDLTEAEEVRRLHFVLYEMVQFLNIEEALIKSILYTATTGCSGISWDGWYTTALHLAAELGNETLIPLLAALGAEPSAVDSTGRTAMDVACLEQHWGSVWLLAKLQFGGPGSEWQEQAEASDQKEGAEILRSDAAADHIRLREELPDLPSEESPPLDLIPRPRFV